MACGEACNHSSRRFEKAHPIDLAQRAQRVKAGLPPRMERR
jgi:hypothetical protein